MISAFSIRHAAPADEPTLAWLGMLAGQSPVRRPALIADVDGIPAAAISMVDGRVVLDPFRPVGHLREQLRLHRSGWRLRAPDREAAKRTLRAALPFMV
jgi:hypothetical protein